MNLPEKGFDADAAPAVSMEALQGLLLGIEAVQFSVRVTNHGADARFDAYVASEVEGATNPPADYGFFNLLWEGVNENMKLIRADRKADIHVARFMIGTGVIRFMIPPRSPQSGEPFELGNTQPVTRDHGLAFDLQIRDEAGASYTRRAIMRYPERQSGETHPNLPVLYFEGEPLPLLASVLPAMPEQSRSPTPRDWEHAASAQEQLREASRPFIPRTGWVATCESVPLTRLGNPEFDVGPGVRLRITGPEIMGSFRCVVARPGGEKYEENEELAAASPTLNVSEDTRVWPDEFSPLANRPWPSGDYIAWWYGYRSGAQVDLATVRFSVNVDGEYAGLDSILPRRQRTTADSPGQRITLAVTTDNGPPWDNAAPQKRIQVTNRSPRTARDCHVEAIGIDGTDIPLMWESTTQSLADLPAGEHDFLLLGFPRVEPYNVILRASADEVDTPAIASFRVDPREDGAWFHVERLSESTSA